MNKKVLLLRHVATATFAAFVVFLFWLSRLEWTPDMRLWRGFGDAGLVLLFLALAIGPLAKLWKPAWRALSWRREIGIWFALLSLTHGILIANGWAQWNVMRFLGYEFVPQFERYARLEPGFGLANLEGLAALFLALVLMATSSDRAVNFFGIASWRWLHYGAYIIFYLVALHVTYFLFIHYTISFHRSVPPPNWFRYPFLIMTLTVFTLQTSAFTKTVIQQRNNTDYVKLH
ncbi:MAG: ferric reductase-like transmembrane domain-containing protein [Acidimicrobiaceae bacterium]|nr:ferric reductase-like transmembrane domain-containing protein [Acidimicrobiaceae bacterium]